MASRAVVIKTIMRSVPLQREGLVSMNCPLLSSSRVFLKLSREQQTHCRKQHQCYHTSNASLTDKIPITYVYPDGEERQVEAEVGMNLLDVAHANDIELEGACGGELACATCHLIFEQKSYDDLPEKVDEEDDMLDLAYELTDTSRLGCQVCASRNLSGTKVKIPDDGY